jgi:hypothetical protein
LNEASAHAINLAETATRIKKENDLFNSKVSFAKSDIISNIFEAINTCFSGWSTHLSD